MRFAHLPAAAVLLLLSCTAVLSQSGGSKGSGDSGGEKP